MKVLVIGGTRFLGKRLVEILLKDGHSVTVVSHHPENCPKGALIIGNEREVGVQNLVGEKFDIVFDFIAYDKSGPNQIFKSIQFKAYILISSTWVTRMGSSSLCENDVSYVSKKIEAETAALIRWRSHRDVVILRLPILFGKNDHTSRLQFYSQRIMDNYPIICVNGGENIAQVVWVEDVAQAINIWVKQQSFFKYRIWVGQPDKGKKVKEIVKNISTALNKKINIVNMSSGILAKKLPGYLDIEPLWRLTGINLSRGNLFKNTGYHPTLQEEWMKIVAEDWLLNNSRVVITKLRRQEITLFKNGGYTHTA